MAFVVLVPDLARRPHYCFAPATDYVRMDENLAVGGIFREQQNTPQESDMVPFW